MKILNQNELMTAVEVELYKLDLKLSTADWSHSELRTQSCAAINYVSKIIKLIRQGRYADATKALSSFSARTNLGDFREVKGQEFDYMAA